MNKKTTDIISYLGWIGIVLTFIFGDRENCKFHMNQALVLTIASTAAEIVAGMTFIKYIGWIFGVVGVVASVFCLVCWIIAFIAAIKGEEKSVPFFGQFKILK